MQPVNGIDTDEEQLVRVLRALADGIEDGTVGVQNVTEETDASIPDPVSQTLSVQYVTEKTALLSPLEFDVEDIDGGDDE